ncbi:MAG: hypothetical protein WD906_00610 [Anaerolineales bacterium]
MAYYNEFGAGRKADLMAADRTDRRTRHAPRMDRAFHRWSDHDLVCFVSPSRGHGYSATGDDYTYGDRDVDTHAERALRGHHRSGYHRL